MSYRSQSSVMLVGELETMTWETMRIETRLDNLQVDRKRIAHEVNSMTRDVEEMKGVVQRFAPQKLCSCFQCVFRSKDGKHLPHAGPCVKTKGVEVDIVAYRTFKIRSVLKQLAIGECSDNEDACESWGMLSAKLVKYQNNEIGKTYVAARLRCEKELRKFMTINMPVKLGIACPLCKLEIENELPRYSRIRPSAVKKPYITISPYATTFVQRHLEREHWRSGWECTKCTKLFAIKCHGEQHISTRKGHDINDTSLRWLIGSWTCMRQRLGG